MAPSASPWLVARVLLVVAPVLANMPLGIDLGPLATRCVHEVVPKDVDATVELFVESGGKLEVHLKVEGPLATTGWDKIPEAQEATEVIYDKVISNGREEDFDDSFLYSFQSKGGAYRVCVSNDMNRVANKVVQVDIRSSATKPVAREDGEPIKLVSDPGTKSASGKTDKEEKDSKERQAEVEVLERSIKRLKRGLRKLQQQQAQERHRQAVHTAVNQDSNNHMVLGSLIETVVFVGTACFQIIFVRAWFDGKTTKQWA
eukprot:FR739068.1.p1 GENE.FR739068.1~~FR739068.1.p1  ORF type:complete len:269 (+),score=45.22 FR739068.1:33-809(+)